MWAPLAATVAEDGDDPARPQRRRGTPDSGHLSAPDRSRFDSRQDRRREPAIPDPSANRGRGGMTTYTTPTTQPAPPYGGPPAVPPRHVGEPPVMPPRRRRRRTGIVAAAGALVIALAATAAAVIALTHPVTPAQHTINVVPPPPVTYSSTEIQAAKDTACSTWDKAARAIASAGNARASLAESTGGSSPETRNARTSEKLVTASEIAIPSHASQSCYTARDTDPD